MTKRRSSGRARRARLEARRRETRRYLVAGLGLLALAVLFRLTGTLPEAIRVILILLGIGLLIGSVILARRSD